MKECYTTEKLISLSSHFAKTVAARFIHDVLIAFTNTGLRV